MSDLEPIEPQRVLERQRLMDDLWPCPPPPPDFADRVLTGTRPETGRAIARRPQRPSARPIGRPIGRRWSLAAAFAGGALFLAAGALVINRVLPGDDAAGAGVDGHVVSEDRRTIEIGERALAVAEAGSALAWTTGPAGAVRVEQSWGDVFYRVLRGGPFVVSTPVGEVEVTGTCFRVALRTTGDGSGERGMLVEVFEGGVRARSAGHQVALRAGERARLQPGRIPLRMDRPLGGASTAAAPGYGEPPESLTATVDELRARERASQTRTLELEARLRELEKLLPHPPGGKESGLPSPTKAYDFTPDERRALAARCLFRWTLPRHLTSWAPPTFDQTLVLDPVERAAVVREMEEQRTAFVEELRAIYTEVTGDTEIGAKLSPMGLQHEIDGKTPRPDGTEARQLILLEWAGSRRPPSEAELPRRPAVERYWRLLVGATDETIRRLTRVMGPDRARQLTHELVNTGVYGREPGCPSRDPSQAAGRERR